ncbi:MAG: DUF4266 domain-containing protein [Lewinellaceae bacterium]|nr:DUF4266 domain-containing protein [Lewinellaceae bacterium]
MQPSTNYKAVLLCLFSLLVWSSCQTVKPYQRTYLNDPEMQMGVDAGASFEGYVQAIREGAIIPGGQKASGGCGCN